MPIPTTMSDPMLGTFRNMLAEVQAKGLTGAPVDEMRTHLSRMEHHAQAHDDISAFTGALMQEDLFNKFSTAYGRALAGAAATSAASGAPGDLLAQSVAAYEQALAQHRATPSPTGALIIPHLEEIVALGGSGISYWSFLRQLEERGLSRALDGAAPATRAGLARSLELAQADWDRWRIDRFGRVLHWYDGAIATAPFGQPDSIVLTMVELGTEIELAPYAARWDATVRHWEHALDGVIDWLDAFTSFAPTDDRWRSAGASAAAVQRNITRTQECAPGELAIRLEQLGRLDVTWEALVNHESFVWQYTARQLAASDERLRLAFATRPHCVPGQRPPRELIAASEELRRTGRDLRPDRRQRPPWGTPMTTLRW